MNWLPWRQFRQSLKNELGSADTEETSEASQERQAARAPPVLQWPRLQRANCFGNRAHCSTVLERFSALLPLSSQGREGVRDGVVNVNSRQAEHCPRVAALTRNPGWHPRPAAGAPPGQEAQL